MSNFSVWTHQSDFFFIIKQTQAFHWPKIEALARDGFGTDATRIYVILCAPFNHSPPRSDSLVTALRAREHMICVMLCGCKK